MSETAEQPQVVDQPRAPLGRRLLRLLIAAGSLTVLGAAAVSWVSLSRPFDPPQMSALPPSGFTAPAAVAATIPPQPGVVTAVTYHAVSDTDRAASTLTRRAFAEHMSMLAAAGYQTVRLTDIERMLAGLPVQLPERPLLLTFDDGAVTDWTTVDPVLRQHGFTAAAFLTTGRVVEPGRPSFYLSTRQIESMRESGRWDFGIHTHELHTRVAVPGGVRSALANRVVRDGRQESLDEWRRRVQADLAASQDFFRTVLGAPAIAFSYPFGESGADGNTAELATELPLLLDQAGIRAAFVGEQVPTGHVEALTATSPRWVLPRIGVRATTTAEELRRMIARSIPVSPPHDLTALPWQGESAECLVKPGVAVALKVAANGYGSCVPAELNTTRWRDYTVVTRMTGINRRTTAIVAVRDGDGAGHRGRVEVVVGEARLVIREQVGDGPRTVLATGVIRPNTRDELTIEVRGNRVTAQLPDNRPLTAVFNPRLHAGGVLLSVASKSGRSVTFTAPTLSTADTARDT